ncbi:MAG: hypothetical protein IPG07_03095 [Crocinitomicaceae bacterium]|nr:hypothetical protein [Crocinitomicaceae bacterium]
MIRNGGIFFLMLTFLSCKKDRLSDEKAFLIGNWNWIYSDHDYGWCDNQQLEETLTPLSEGKDYSVRFVEKGKIEFFEDGEIIEVCRIVFDFFEVNAQGEAFFIFYLNNDKARGMVGAGNDTLNLKYPYVEEILGCGDYDNYFTKE